jgi:hypothetical protein
MKAMHSSWSISYSGQHSGVTLKKLERAGRFVALEVEKERLLIQDEKVEHASFLVEHDSESWPALVMSILSTARVLMPEWRILLGANSVHGSFGDILSAYKPGYKLPVSGLRSVAWEVNSEQKYVRMRWLSGTPNRW